MYRILGLGGGGIKGYLTLQILQYLEEQSGKKISDMFDLVIGTSSGALIGALIDTLPAHYISELLRDSLAKRLFHPNIFSCEGIIQSKYNSRIKEECIKEVLGFKSNANNFDYAAVSYDIKNNKPVIFNTLEHELTNTYYLNKRFTFVEACLASSAAPIYWDPVTLHDGSILIDGGLCANNPISVGIKLALNKNIKLEDLHIVNIGTGLNTRQYKLYKGNNPFKWLLPLFNTMLNGQTHITNMLYENESLHYYNLDVPLIHANDNIDCLSNKNYEDLILDSKELIKLKELELHTILHTFI